MRFISGEVRTSEIRTLTTPPTLSYSVDLQFNNGVQGRIDILPNAGLVEGRYELFGDGFRAVITSPFGPQRSLRCYQQDRLVLEETAEAETPEDVTQGFYGEATELIGALSQGSCPKPSIEDVFPSVELCFQLADRIEKNATDQSTAG
jgi:hypothetical protein